MYREEFDTAFLKDKYVDRMRKALIDACQRELLVYDSYERPQWTKQHEFINENDRVFSAFDQYSKGGHAPNGNELNRYYMDLSPYYTLEDEDDDTLIFESRFESGNLMKACRVGESEYNLYLNSDTNTSGHT